MKISSKDLETLKCLIKVEKRILRIYTDSNMDKNDKAKILLRLVEDEDTLINSLNLSQDKYKSIKEYIIHKTGLYQEEILLKGFSPALDKISYPYHRLLARLEEKAKVLSHKSYDEVELSFNKLLVKNLYKVLIQKSKMLEQQENFIISDLATFILIDSQEAEIEILKNNLEPLETIVDDANIAFNSWVIDILEEEGVSQEAMPFALQGVTFSESYLKRILLYSHFGAASYVLENHFVFNSPQKVLQSPLSWAYICYVEAIISILPLSNRGDLYKGCEDLLKIPKFRLKEFGDFLKDCIDDIENNIVPSIVKVSLFKENSF